MNKSAVFAYMSSPLSNETGHLPTTSTIDPTGQWFQALKVASQKANILLNFSFALEKGISMSPVGRFPAYDAMIRHIRKKAENNWTAYEAIK